MPNLSQLSGITTAATALSNLLLVSPQDTVGYKPQNTPNADGTISTAQSPPAFIFDYEGEQTASLESDITDHYIEDNTAVQDQVALKPEIITTHGFVAELNDVPPFPLQYVKEAAEKLTAIGAYAPQLSATANLAYAEAFQLYQVGQNAVNTAVAAWSSIGSIGGGGNGQSVIGSNGITAASNQNKQQIAFQKFYGYWRNRTLFTVQTPWAVFQNMAILRLRAIQSEETNVITDFEITFKMIRIAQTLNLSAGFPVSYAGRLNSQASSPTDLGTSSPTSGGPSFVSSLASAVA